MKHSIINKIYIASAVAALMIPHNIALSANESWHVQFVRATGVVINPMQRIVTVALIDDGYESTDADLRGRLWSNSDEIAGNAIDDDRNGFTDDTNGWNFIENSNDISSREYHGTDVARVLYSIVEATDSAGAVRIMPLVVTTRLGEADPAALKKAIRYATDNGATIINISVGGTATYFSAEFDSTVQYAYDHEVMIVAAAGNGATEQGVGSNLNKIKISPVCNDGDTNMVLGVGALAKNGEAASWSNTGRCIDLFAPGETITLTAGSAVYEVNGTSFAAPIVSGIAAVLAVAQHSLRGTALRDTILDSVRFSHGVAVPDLARAVHLLPKEVENAFTHTISDGVLARGERSPAVYNIQSGLKRHIVNERVFLTQGYSWNAVSIVPDAALAAMPLGAPITFSNIDKDRDGLTTAEENACGTDPLDDDSDNDGYLDGEEVRNGYTPLGIGRGASCL